MKRTAILLLVLACTCLAPGCKKEAVTKEATAAESLSLSAFSAAPAPPAATGFGVLINDADMDEKITVSQELGVTYVRDAIILESFNGKAPMMDRYIENGFKVLLNINNNHVNDDGVKEPNTFPKDMAKYRKNLNAVFDVYTPEVAVIENEPYNDNRYYGNINGYFTQLETAVDVCKQRGIKVADGGLNPQMVCILVYQDYIARGMQAKADDFGSRALKNKNLRAAQGKGSETTNDKIEQTRSMVEFYKTIDLDYVNLHWYEPANENNDPSISAPGVLKEVADYLRSATGKKVITNEFGQDNEKTSLVSTMVKELELGNFVYAIQFSGEGPSGSVSLHKGVKLKPNGIAFRDAVAE